MPILNGEQAGSWERKRRKLSFCLILVSCCFIVVVGAAASVVPQLRLLSEHAQEALKKGDFKEAQEAYQEIVKRDPHSAEAYSNLGLALYMQTEYSGAISALRTALGFNPNLVKAEILLALSYFHVSDFRNTIPLLEKVYVVKRDDPIVVQYLGLAYLNVHEDEKALAMLDRWVKIEPNSPDALYYKGTAASYVSLDAFEKLKEIAPQSCWMHELQAELFAEQGRTSAAIVEYKKALAEQPRLPGLHFALGKLYWKEDRLTEARTELEQELQISPYDASTQYMLGDVLLHQNNLTGASLHLSRALEARPDLISAKLDMAKLYGLEGKTADAINVLQSVIRLDADSPEPHFMLYELYKNLKYPDKAATELAAFQRLKRSAVQRRQNSIELQEIH